MSCSVAVTSSPVFSASRIPVTCKTSPETLSLGKGQHHLSSTAVVDGSPSTASSSPFLRFQRIASSLRTLKNEMSTLDTDGVDSSLVSPSSSSASLSCFSSALASNSCGSASVFKRKRPARIDIPMMRLPTLHPLPDSGGPVEVEAESARYSVYCKKGRKRLEMEDRHSAILNIGGDPQSAFFGIFDGHGGAKAAEFVSERIGDRILEEVTSRKPEEKEGGILLEIAVTKGYLKTDAEFLKQELGGGTCCVTALVRKGDLVVSNSGDCRAVLSVSGSAEVLTSDHRLSRKDEKERIENLGGYVDCCRGVWRLQSSLAVSRGIGDSHLKQWVIPDPETRILRIEPNHEFLILASDGLWDKVSNQEAVDVARPLCVTSPKPNVLSACRRLVDLSIARGSVDDISVMIVQLGQFL